MSIEFHVKSSEWNAMPEKTKSALTEMVKCAAKMLKVPRGLIARTAIQCTYPDGSGKVGTWLYRGSSPKDKDCAVLPCFLNCVALFNWCRDNGWKPCGDAHVYEPTEQKGKVVA